MDCKAALHVIRDELGSLKREATLIESRMNPCRDAQMVSTAGTMIERINTIEEVIRETVDGERF